MPRRTQQITSLIKGSHFLTRTYPALLETTNSMKKKCGWRRHFSTSILSPCTRQVGGKEVKTCSVRVTAKNVYSVGRRHRTVEIWALGKVVCYRYIHMYPQTIPDASLPTLYHYFTVSISFEKAILWIVKFPLWSEQWNQWSELRWQELSVNCQTFTAFIIKYTYQTRGDIYTNCWGGRGVLCRNIMLKDSRRKGNEERLTDGQATPIVHHQFLLEAFSSD